MEYMKPEDIEKRSFEIIEELLNGKKLDAANAHVIKRCIHTSADFDYAENLHFSPDAVSIISAALRGGCRIVTDTQMARAGINKKLAARYGVEVECFIADKDVAASAKANGGTRAVAAVEKALALPGTSLFAVGNAPTALLRLHEAIDAGYKPAGIIGVPVGFVNVVESKKLIINSGVTCIVARGRKGGSNIAAAICNALLYDL